MQMQELRKLVKQTKSKQTQMKRYKTDSASKDEIWIFDGSG